MVIIALETIRHNSIEYKKGQVIQEITEEQANRLIQLQSAEKSPVSGGFSTDFLPEPTNEIECIRFVFEKMERKDLLAYGKKVELSFEEGTSDEKIIEKLLEDATQNGVDLESLTKEFLVLYGQKLGKSVNSSMNREQLYDAIEK